MYGTNESLASNTAVAFVLPTMHAELTTMMAMPKPDTLSVHPPDGCKYNYNQAVTVKYAKVFVHTQGTASIIIRVFDDNGPTECPELSLLSFQYPAANVTAGWNYIHFPMVSW
jgi:hypothetical protein